MKIVVAALALIGLAAAPVEDLKLGEVVADIAMKTLDGKEIKLADFRGDKGKVVVVYFQSSHCPSALKADDVKKIADKFGVKDSAVQFIAVFSYGKDNEGEVKSYVESNKLSYPCVADGDDKVTSHLGASKVNQTFVIDRAGKLVYRGAFTSRKTEYVIEAVNAALGKGKAPESDNKFQG